MLTYTTRRNLYGTLTNDTSTANLTLGDTLLANAEREVISMRSWPFLEKLYTQTTTANQQFYQVPNEVETVIAVSVIINGITYVAKQAPTTDFWNQLNISTTVRSDMAYWWYFRDGAVGLYPIPSNTTASALNIVGRRRPTDLNKADYTTGTIVTATNGSATITGSGTSWTAGMKGSYLRITAGNAANLGDGQWYEISTVDSAIQITLVNLYQGTSIAAGSAAYTIGQASLLPEGYDMLPVYKAASEYFTSLQPEFAQADRYLSRYSELMQSMVDAYGRKSDNMEIVGTDDVPLINPNLTVTY